MRTVWNTVNPYVGTPHTPKKQFTISTAKWNAALIHLFSPVPQNLFPLPGPKYPQVVQWIKTRPNGFTSSPSCQQSRKFGVSHWRPQSQDFSSAQPYPCTKRDFGTSTEASNDVAALKPTWLATGLYIPSGNQTWRWKIMKHPRFQLWRNYSVKGLQDYFPIWSQASHVYTFIDGFPYNPIRDWQFHWHIYKETRIFCVSRGPSLSDRWSCCIHNTGRSSSVAAGAHFAFVDTRSADIPICLIYII